jgi:hypothetical protein
MGIALKSMLCNNVVMPGPVPGIHVFASQESKTWMAGTGPAMTGFKVRWRI